MAIIKISEENGGVYAEEANPDPRTIYIGDELRAELEQIEEQLLVLANEPDEILMPNMQKFSQVDYLNNRVEEINNILQ
jgi:hypothetical protein